MRLATTELLRVNLRHEGNLEPPQALYEALKGVIERSAVAGKGRLTIVCVGTPLNTGDALGPLVGSFVKERLGEAEAVQVRGTLEEPVHRGRSSPEWGSDGGSPRSAMPT